MAFWVIVMWNISSMIALPGISAAWLMVRSSGSSLGRFSFPIHVNSSFVFFVISLNLDSLQNPPAQSCPQMTQIGAET
jgi:hypothetical protein